MPATRSLQLIALITAIAMIASACGGGGSSDTPTTTGLTTNYDITPQEDITVLDESTVEDRIVASDPAAGEYRFEAGTDLASATVGQPIVIPGEGFGIVREVVDEGGNVLLRVDEATLADVIQDGEVSIDYDVSWDDFDITYEQLAALPGVTNVRVIPGGSSGASSGGFTNISLAEPSTKYEIKFTKDKWSFTVTFEPKDGKLNFDLTASYGTGATQKIAAITGKGWITGFSFLTEALFSDGGPTSLNSEVNGLEGELELQWAAFRTPATTLAQIVRFNVPVSVPFPIPGPLGIPFVLQIKMAGRIVPELTAEDASSGGQWKVSYSSDQGFNFDDSGGKPTGSAKSQDIGVSGDTVTAGLGPAGFGLGFEFPRFELGIAGLNAFAFITMDMYSTSLWTPGTVLSNDIPPCQYGYTKHSAVAGYELKILGWAGVSEQYPLFEKQIDKYLDGEVCTLTGD